MTEEVRPIEEQIRLVATNRKAKDSLTQLKKESYTEWEARNKKILDELAVATETLTKAEELLRKQTIEAYRLTGNKSPAEGVGIRETTKLTYDIAIAQLWGYEHKVALKLDTPVFEKIAKASSLPFVTTETIPTATIATDLEKYLDKEEVK